MSERKTYAPQTIRVPSWIDFDNLASKYLTVCGAKRPSAHVKKRDYLALLVHYIAHRYSERLNDRRFNVKSKGVDAFSENIKELVGSDYARYLAFLEGEKVVVRTYRGRTNHGSSRFEICEPGAGSTINKVDYILTTQCADRFRSFVSAFSDVSKALMDRIPGLCRSLESGRLTVVPSVFSDIDGYMNRELDELAKRWGGRTKRFRKEEKIMRDACEAVRQGIRKLQSGKFDFFRDYKGHRLHTPITNIIKGVRKSFRIDNLPVVEIDFKNSQFFFLNLLMVPSFWQKTPASGLHISQFCDRDSGLDRFISDREYSELGTYLDAAPPEIRKLAIETVETLCLGEDHPGRGRWRTPRERATVRGTIIMLLILVNNVQKDRDLNFSCLVTEGRLYERLMEVPEIKKLLDSPDHDKYRSSVKEKFIHEMFGDPKKAHWNKKAVIRYVFPELDMLLRMIKRSSYQAAPILLQRIEARIILEGISESYLKKYNGEVIFTIHDSILVKCRHAKQLEEHIKEYMRLHYGSVPELAVKRLYDVPSLPINFKYTEEMPREIPSYGCVWESRNEHPMSEWF